MLRTYQVTGELTDQETVKLDNPLPASVGKVRLSIEVLSSQPRPDLKQFMERMWEEQRKRGHVAPTKEEVDAYLKEERDSWDF